MNRILKWTSIGISALFVFAILVPLFGQFIGDDAETGEPGVILVTERTPGANACILFRDTARQFASGILTAEEERTEFKKVYEFTSGAEPAIQQAATEILKALTEQDNTAYAFGIISMLEACVDAGYLIASGALD